MGTRKFPRVEDRQKDPSAPHGVKDRTSTPDTPALVLEYRDVEKILEVWQEKEQAIYEGTGAAAVRILRKGLGLSDKSRWEPSVLYPAQQSSMTDSEGEPHLDPRELRTHASHLTWRNWDTRGRPGVWEKAAAPQDCRQRAGLMGLAQVRWATSRAGRSQGPPRASSPGTGGILSTTE